MDPLLEYAVRLVAASICGALIGLEREKRSKNAGIRTHIIVALASALMMLVSKYGFFDVLPYDSVSLDPSRIAAGVVSAIGFLGAGVIIIRRGDSAALGITTAAGLWATVGVGMAIGAGMYAIGAIATLMMLFIQLLLHLRRLSISSDGAGEITVNLAKAGCTLPQMKERLQKKGITVRSVTISRGHDGDMRVTARMSYSTKAIDSIMQWLKDDGSIEGMTLYIQQ